MAISEGEKIPAVTVKNTDMSDVTTDELFGGKKVVLFAVPGAFTPTCSNQHLPGYVENADALKAKSSGAVASMSRTEPDAPTTAKNTWSRTAASTSPAYRETPWSWPLVTTHERTTVVKWSSAFESESSSPSGRSAA